VKEKVGKTARDPNLRDRGTAEKVSGKVQRKIGEVKQCSANSLGLNNRFSPNYQSRHDRSCNAETFIPRVVAALVESEQRYRILVEGVRRYAIFMLDPKGIITTWNRVIYELLGYSREEVVGQSGAIVFNSKDRAAGTFKKELALAKRSGESVAVHSAVRKDGTELQVHDTATALFDSAGALIGFAKVARAIDVSENLSL
jgi:PAS domain S-box-containing protein